MASPWLLVGIATFVPIWRSGKREGMNMWAWLGNHTIFGPPSEYIPEDYYDYPCDNVRGIGRKA